MNEALHLIDRPATLRHARINAVEAERFGVVSSDGHRYWLKPALGCLLQPALGDRVLVSLDGEEGYILSVLERSQPQSAELRVAGDLRLHLPSGALSIETRDGLLLDAGPTLAVQAESSVVQFAEASLSVGTLTVTGEQADSHWIEHNLQAHRASEQATFHSAEYADSWRKVEGHEEVEAGSMRQRVARDWSISGETLDLFADITVALDAERIKLG
ncbi:DUF3540 domain-containing protein [Pseudomonas sp. N040]|uniref:DUF3540 domain-containing protein n=1 Tax=Pseudomonas sp. N040 TaxID=2785325 RepID=UPI0018A2EC24|nr:DUF3540 domain-containing protein [Pseudomonas sp. N040]MBF7729560.1 DUF3540 domain-containing protein [Pseudomonas sp. N040]MBW7013200.1 DUF3540 domain-containing protein [Pseudomonas sp. N040]